MFEFFESCVTGPVLPATILLSCLMLWSIATILTGFGTDLSTGDWLHLPNPAPAFPDHEGLWSGLQHHLGDAFGIVVLAPAKWLNLKDLPAVIWGGVFTLNWWSVSITNWFVFDLRFFGNQQSLWFTILLIVRNLGIALLATKLITQPMRAWFKNHEIKALDLVGKEIEVWSYDATTSHGQGKYKTDGSPLLLNIQTDGPILPKGTRVWITHYDPKRRVYIVSATTTSTPISTR